MPESDEMWFQTPPAVTLFPCSQCRSLPFQEHQMARSRMIQPIVRKFAIGEEPKDILYWLTVPPVVRVMAVEDIRREYHGWKHGAEPRLQRVLSIVKR